MWIPATADEVEQAARTGQLEETPSFDAKRDLPASSRKNADVAVDVAATTTDGGLLYGLGEDEDDRLTIASPIVLVGAAERSSQIVITRITEVPLVEVRECPCPDDSSRGYLAVVVPQSPRARIMDGHAGRRRQGRPWVGPLPRLRPTRNVMPAARWAVRAPPHRPVAEPGRRLHPSWPERW